MRNKKFSIFTIDDKPYYLPAYFYHTCCDCELRHIVVIEKKGKGIVMSWGRDDHGTMLGRKVKKLKKGGKIMGLHHHTKAQKKKIKAKRKK